jgi:hypothetical protein
MKDTHMKRTILVMLLLALITTPCFAQEVEPDGLFSLDGTLWRYFRLDLAFGTSVGQPYFDIEASSGERGFFQGNMYSCSENDCGSGFPYIDTPVLGVFFTLGLIGIDLWVMQPTVGIGLTMTSYCGGMSYSSGCGFGIGMMFKIDNNWSPSDVE